MEVENKKNDQLSSSGLLCNTKCFPSSSSPSSEKAPENCSDEKQEAVVSNPKSKKRTPGGWKSMPFILGNETFERLASVGLLGNFTVFLMTQFHLEQASAANLINIWSGVTNFAPLLGAFISDAYVGKFPTIAVSSFASLLGMVTLTLIAWISKLRPPPCTPEQVQNVQCKGPNSFHMGILVMALGFLSIGTGGIRPCSLPFGVDQFDATTDKGKKGIASFFNWYYVTFTMVMMIALTLVLYVQDSISWVWGFAIPSILMFCSIVLFFSGTKMYVYVKPQGSVFSGIVQTLVAAFNKRRVKLPAGEADGVYYDPPFTGDMVTKLPLTNRYRFLNKAAVIMEGEIKADGSRTNPWRLSSIQQIEEVKCIIKVVPVWAAGIICFAAIVQQATFITSQALKMERHLGSIKIPPGSLLIISMITIAIWIPIYDRLVVPALRRVTKLEGGITLLQRIGIGMVFSILSMVVAGLIEHMRRAHANAHPGAKPISILWLAPQHVLMGFAEAFNIIGQMEFYYKEFPESMKSVANSIFFITSALASYLSSLLIMIVREATGKHGQPDWLYKDINAAKVDYFFYIIAAMGVLNFIYFLVVARRYNYKNNPWIADEKPPLDVEA